MSHTYTMEDKFYVQFFLDSLEPMEQFQVIFLKENGEQRKLTCCLDPNGKTRKDSVPVLEYENGEPTGNWKSFNINRVLSIQTN